MEVEVTVGKTIQERQYEPVNISISVRKEVDAIVDDIERKLVERFEKRGMGRRFK